MNKYTKIVLISVLALALIFTMAYAKSKHAWLGVMTQTVDNEIAEAFDLKVEYGAVVNEVVKDSPADKAGFQEGDVIIDINGKQINDAEDLVDYIHDSEAGTKITVTLMRSDNKIAKEVTLDEQADRLLKRKIIKRFPRVYFHDDDDNNNTWKKDHYYLHDDDFDFDFDWDDYRHSSYIGVKISDMTDQLRSFFGVKEDVGVLIAVVEDDGPAGKAGLKAGDVIISVDGKEVENNIDVRRLIGKKEAGEQVDIVVVRNKEQKSFKIEVGKRDNDYNYSYKYYAPDIDVKIPKIKIGKSAHWNEDFFERCDSDNFEDCIIKLNLEMDDLKDELSHLKKDQIDKIEKVLENLREQLKELRENLSD